MERMHHLLAKGKPHGRRLKFNIYLDDATAVQVRALAASESVSLSHKIEELIEWGLLDVEKASYG